MKVAVATDDGVSVSGHFGRSGYFVVFDLEGSSIHGREKRVNTFTAHARGECHGGQQGSHAHSHGPIIEALQDCSAVLCGGMGWRAANELAAHGIPPFVVQPGCSLEQALSAYLEGKASPGPTCVK